MVAMRHVTIGVRARRGMTFVEMMVTLAIIVIVLVFAAGPFTTLVAQNRMSSAVNEFVATLQGARQFAVTGRSPATVCPDKSGACGTATSDWGSGAMVFADANSDSILNPTEVVKSRWAASPNLTMNSNVTALTFKRDGTAASTPATGKALWLFCDPNGRVSPRIVTVYESGVNVLYTSTSCALPAM